jgi:hypothetical protein
MSGRRLSATNQTPITGLWIPYDRLSSDGQTENQVVIKGQQVLSNFLTKLS